MSRAGKPTEADQKRAAALEMKLQKLTTLYATGSRPFDETPYRERLNYISYLARALEKLAPAHRFTVIPVLIDAPDATNYESTYIKIEAITAIKGANAIHLMPEKIPGDTPKHQVAIIRFIAAVSSLRSLDDEMLDTIENLFIFQPMITHTKTNTSRSAAQRTCRFTHRTKG
jgi:hypothetical protein